MIIGLGHIFRYFNVKKLCSRDIFCLPTTFEIDFGNFGM